MEIWEDVCPVASVGNNQHGLLWLCSRLGCCSGLMEKWSLNPRAQRKTKRGWSTARGPGGDSRRMTLLSRRGALENLMSRHAFRQHWARTLATGRLACHKGWRCSVVQRQRRTSKHEWRGPRRKEGGGRGREDRSGVVVKLSYLQGLEALHKELGFVFVLFCLAGIGLGFRQRPWVRLRLICRQRAVLFGAVVLLLHLLWEFILPHRPREEVRERETKIKREGESKKKQMMKLAGAKETERSRGRINDLGQSQGNESGDGAVKRQKSEGGSEWKREGREERIGIRQAEGTRGRQLRQHSSKTSPNP